MKRIRGTAVDDAVNTFHCEKCIGYKNPIKVRKYTKDDDQGWVTCAAGNTIKKKTMACHNFSDGTRAKSPQGVERIKAAPTRVKAEAPKIKRVKA